MSLSLALLVPLALPAVQDPGQPAWQESYLPPGSVGATATVLCSGGDSVLVAGSERFGTGLWDYQRVWRAYDAVTGSELWTVAEDEGDGPENWLTGSVSDGTLLAMGTVQESDGSAHAGRIEARDAATGELKWTELVADATWIRPRAQVAHDGRFFTAVSKSSGGLPGAGAEDILECRDVETGALAWTTFVGLAPQANDATLSMAADSEHVYVAGFRSFGLFETEGFVRAFDADDGQLVWTRKFPTGAFIVVFCDLEVVDGRVHALPHQSASGVPLLHAFDATTGETLWEWGESNATRFRSQRMLVDDGKVFVGGRIDQHLGVVALDAETGAHGWFTRYDPSPATLDAIRAILPVDDNLVAVSASDGVGGPGTVGLFELRAGNGALVSAKVGDWASQEAELLRDAVLIDDHLVVAGNVTLSPVSGWIVQAYALD